MSALFASVYRRPPVATGRAPARVNLMGEHTDYNDGLVLPLALPYRTTVSVGPGEPGTGITGYSSRFGAAPARPVAAAPRGDWLDYVVGCVQALRETRPLPVEDVEVTVESEVPVGAGLSSSAALEVATLRALRGWLEIEIGDDAIARLAQRAEQAYVGVPCGIMDQMVSALGQTNRAMFLDTRDLSRAEVPLPTGVCTPVVHCGVAHRLADGGYRRRREECREAAGQLGVGSLREVRDLDVAADLPPPLDRRVRHVVTENARVRGAVEALRAGQLARLGRLMIESHASQRDDYEVSIPEVDAVAAAAVARGAAGARLTGGGFGGSVVALVAEDAVQDWWTTLAGDCPGARLMHPSPQQSVPNRVAAEEPTTP